MDPAGVFACTGTGTCIGQLAGIRNKCDGEKVSRLVLQQAIPLYLIIVRRQFQHRPR